MQTRTAAFDAAIVLPHDLAVTVDILYNRLPVADGVDLDVTGGGVTLDRTAAQRGRCTQVALAEPLLIPTSTGGVLTPFGYEAQIKRGILYPDGTTELMGLGVYPIQTSKLDGVTQITVIDGFDRSQQVVDARLEDDYSIAVGTNYATAIRALIEAGVSGLTFSFATTAYTTPALVFPAQADRWQSAQGMAKSIGMELFFDGVGTCVLRPEPTFTAIPVWTLSEGEAGLLVSADLSMDRSTAYNRVIATGENTGLATVPRGVWTDDDPSSPTYYFGGFGRKPRFYASSFITSDAQAVSAATAIGVAQQGVARSLSFTAVPNPALEPGDAVLVKRDALGVNEVHLIDSLTFGLGSDAPMGGTSRWGSTA